MSSLAATEIGIVVIGRNEGQRLADCLTSIAKQAQDIVYVDSGSTDDSVCLARQLGAKVVALDLTIPFTAARARNEGLTALLRSKPTTRFVQFVDGDCELVAGWLDAGYKFISQRDRVAVACGRRRERHPKSSIYNQLCDIEWNTPIGPNRACGGDSLIRVEAFESVGGFNSGLIAGEEPELCVRLRAGGWEIWRLDAEMTWHDAKIMHFHQWWVRHVRAGHAYAEVLWRHKRSPYALYKKETLRILFWAGAVPLAIGSAALVKPLALLGLIIYPAQVCSIALRHRSAVPDSWGYGLFMTIAKFAEFQGILKFFWRSYRGSDVKLIEYRNGS